MARRLTLPAFDDGAKLPEMVGAVIYVRVSTKEQTENVSLPTQLPAWRSTAVGSDRNRFNRTAATAPLFNYLAPSESADEKVVSRWESNPQPAD